MSKLIPVEHQAQRVLTTQQLAESYETKVQVITNNFNRNKERYQIGKHYYCLEGTNLKDFKTKPQFEGSSKKLNKLYIWTEKGALLHAKSLGTDKAWEIYDVLVETYFRVRETQADMSRLSPQTQAIVNLELKHNALSSQIADAEEKIKGLDDKFDRAVQFAIRSTYRRAAIPQDEMSQSWKKCVLDEIEALQKEHRLNVLSFKGYLYKLLELTEGCNLNSRLNNLKERLAKSGATRKELDRVGKIDVIERDAKLKAGFDKLFADYLNDLGISSEGR